MPSLFAKRLKNAHRRVRGEGDERSLRVFARAISTIKGRSDLPLRDAANVWLARKTSSRRAK